MSNQLTVYEIQSFKSAYKGPPGCEIFKVVNSLSMLLFSGRMAKKFSQKEDFDLELDVASVS
jgi:hypothetical protein